MTSDEFGDIEQLDENLRKWFKEKWVRFGPDGKIRGACARGSEKEGKPKCLPQKKAQNLGKKGRKYAAAKKRREDPNPERRGKAKNVATKKKSNEDIQVNEKWSQKYKDSINCSNPKGFSQKAHCAGKKKNEDMNENIPFNECPNCRGPIVHESMMNEKKDACYHKVRSRYKVWPSAYASGALVQCRKKGAANWGTGGKKKNESSIMKGLVDEGVIIGHDANDPDVAVLGGAGSYKLSNLKKKAQMEANELAKDVSEGKFKNSAYNVKQLANTLNTIVAAEEEMEKLYFGEDYTGMFAAEKTAATNPYGGQKDRQFRGAISETPTDNPTGASGEGGLRKYKPKSAGTFKEDEQLDEGWKMGILGTLAGIIFGPAVGTTLFGESAAGFLAALSTVIAGGYFGKDISSIQDLFDRFTKNPKEFKQLIKQRKIDKKIQSIMERHQRAKVSLKETISELSEVIHAANRKLYKQAETKFESIDPYSLIHNINDDLANLSTTNVVQLPKKFYILVKLYDAFKKSPEVYSSEFEDVLTELRGYILQEITKNEQPNPKQLDEYREMSPALKAAQQNLIALRNKEKATNVPGKRERAPKDKVEIDKPKPASVLTKGAQEVDPATADAIAAFLAKGGEIKKGRPGKAPPIGRNQASKHIGGGGKYRKKSDTPGQGANYRGDKIVAVEEEQLDEKCWDSHKQVGMKKKGGKMVPNCVPKESAIMKGIRR